MNNIISFSNDVFGTVRSMLIDDNPWFVAVDVCNVLGLTNSRKAVSYLDDDEKNTVTINDGIPGNPNKTIISEAGLYSLILRSRKPEAKAFKRWITHEVIPSIRKTGGYVADEDLFIQTYFPSVTGAESVYLKQMMVEVKTANKKLAETTQQLTVVTEELSIARPKAEYYDIVMQCPNLLTTTEIAADYGLSPQALNQMLHDWGVQYKVNGTWVLYSKYKNKGYAQTVTNAIERNGYSFATLHLKWTQRGRLFIYELMKKHGILPTVERMRRSA